VAGTAGLQALASTSRQKASTRALDQSGTAWKGWSVSPGMTQNVRSDRRGDGAVEAGRQDGVELPGEDQRGSGDLRQAGRRP
jgi:hypothetical protein